MSRSALISLRNRDMILYRRQIQKETKEQHPGPNAKNQTASTMQECSLADATVIIPCKETLGHRIWQRCKGGFKQIWMARKKIRTGTVCSERILLMKKIDKNLPNATMTGRIAFWHWHSIPNPIKKKNSNLIDSLCIRTFPRWLAMAIMPVNSTNTQSWQLKQAN